MITGPVALGYRLYTAWLRRQLAGAPIPRHVGIIMDGNRRWARRAGLTDPSLGHRRGAEHLDNLLRWCECAGIIHVTVFVCSTENLARRNSREIDVLMHVIEELADEVRREADPRWSLHTAGLLDGLPDSTANALKSAVEATSTCRTGAHLTLAVGYGGRQELLDAVRSLLIDHADSGAELVHVADTITIDDIARHLYNPDQPEPDLIIRTSGEQRLSNFLLWQAAYSELYFCDAYWPAFREIDFLRALRDYAARLRTYGG